MITFTKEQLIASAHSRIEFAEMMLAGDLEPLKERTWSIELELARIALAAMRQEPVGEVVLGDFDDCGDYPDAKVVCIAAQGQAGWNNFRNGTALYAEPQLSQPAVVDERAAFNAWNNEDNLPIAGVGAKNAAWLAWQARAAMLQGADGTITNEGTIQDGNSPVIHDGGNTTPPYQGWVVTHGGKDYFYRKQSDAVTHLNSAIESGGGASLIAVIAEPVTTAYKLRDAVEIIRNSGIEINAEKIFAERDALNAPDCWCHTCRPVTISDMRFVVCPECGNKRCPHANDHRNACTGSNEPGQEGSAYPAAPQQEVK